MRFNSLPAVSSWLISVLFVMLPFMSPTLAASENEVSSSAIKLQKAQNIIDPAKGYRLGVGDVLTIRVYGEDDLKHEKFRLPDSGVISFPFGDLMTLGMTVGDLERSIADGLRGRFLVNPRVSVSIEEYRPFFIYGPVEKPGGYPFQPGLNISKAISIAGGYKERASKDNKIFVVREGGVGILEQSVDMNTPILPGDTVNIEDYRLFFIYGQVEKPGGYPYQPGLNVRKAVSIAGGFKERASKDKIFIVREGSVDDKAQKIDLNTSVLPGDTVTVEESFF